MIQGEPNQAGVAINRVSRLDLALALLYFSFYIAYLFWQLESEFVHWISLVLVPFGGLYFLHRRRRKEAPLKTTLASVGLVWANVKSGLLVAAVVGLALSAVQLFLSRNADQIILLIQNGKALYLFPLTFVLMVALAGTTEEFFFRGVLQTRFQNVFRSKTLCVILTSIAFGLYHLPYAYLHPRWPSHGDWTSALELSFGQGIPMGIVLGIVYVRTKNNLPACILLHSIFNSLPGMLSIKFGN